jgi:hypothetical protein
MMKKCLKILSISRERKRKKFIGGILGIAKQAFFYKPLITFY